MSEETATKSPTPNQVESAPQEPPKEIDFFEALKLSLENGVHFTKLEWANNEFYGAVQDGILKLHKPDGKWHNWILSDGDLTGKDYIII